MSRIHGRRGRVYCGIASDTATAEPIAFLNQWSMDSSTDRVDVTAFGDNNKVYVAGLPDATGSFAGFYDTETEQLFTASQDGLARKFYLYPDLTDGDYFYGTGFFDFSISVEVAGAATISGSWSAASAVLKVSA